MRPTHLLGLVYLKALSNRSCLRIDQGRQGKTYRVLFESQNSKFWS